MLKSAIYIIFLMASSYCILPLFMDAMAGEINPAVLPTADLKDEGPPPLTRNPFVSVPHDRTYKPVVRDKIERNVNTKKKTETSQKTNKIEDVAKELKLKGILYAGEYSMALLGHRIIKIGDMVGELIVIDIEPKRVILLSDNKLITIQVE